MLYDFTTCIVDAAGTTRYSYDSAGQLLSEDGPWDSDAVNYSYANRLRTGLSLQQPNGSPWSQVYAYDSARRLTNIVSAAGAFGYAYKAGQASSVSWLSLPNGAYITNTHDANARLLSTILNNSSHTVLNSHTYGYNAGNQRTGMTNSTGDYRLYGYDSIGQVETALGYESGGSARLHEQFGYDYDPAGNLLKRTNNAFVQSFTIQGNNLLSTASRSGTLTAAGTTTSAATNVAVNGSNATRYADFTFASTNHTLVNGTNTFSAIARDNYGRSDTNVSTAVLPASISYTHDANGNLTFDGQKSFAYDDENQLIRITRTNEWKSEFVYDGKMRRRVRTEATWDGSKWVTNEIVRYVYDGNLVIQERNSWNLPEVTYTRGKDLSGTLEGAGGIGGLLARTDHSTFSPTHAYYFADGNGNVTMLLNAQQIAVAKYQYDPFGNALALSGPLAEANLYRFSSKERHENSGLIYYLYRHIGIMRRRCSGG